MNYKKIFKIIFGGLFIIFISLYIAGESGYYDYEQSKKAILTKERMALFEEDVKNGKNVDLNDYLESQNKNYNSKLSSACYNASKKINEYAKGGIEAVLKLINRLVED